MRRRSPWVIAVFAVFAVSLVVIGSASAHTVRTPTQLSMSYSWDEATGHFFSGGVSSAKPGCEVGRKITLYRELATSWEAVATRTTTSEGPWWAFSMVDARPGDRFAAAAARKVVQRPGHTHICQGALAGPVTVDPSS